MIRTGSKLRVWLWPLVLAGVSAFGLLSGLLGDGGWDYLSWITLSVPIGVTIWFAVIV